MNLITNLRMLARYNQEINTQLLHCCTRLSTEELNRETHSFFPDIISYWNHLLFGDLILLARLANNNLANFSSDELKGFPQPISPTDSYFQNIDDIIDTRTRLDLLIIKFFNELTELECEKIMTYKTTEGELVCKPVALICQHIFNHQTHHRGQLTCILSQLGVDYGCMDLPVIVADLAY